MSVILDVRVAEKAGPNVMYVYELRSSDAEGTGPLEQEYSVDVSQAAVLELCGKIEGVIADALAGKVDHRGQLAKLGAALYDVLLPQAHGNMPDLRTQLQDLTGPLLVRTNESVVPWDLLHDGMKFLGDVCDVGLRSMVVRRISGGRTMGPIRQALIVGDPLGDLAEAQREAEYVAQWLGAHDVECTVYLGSKATLGDVLMALRSSQYDLFHYCGHVALSRDGPTVGLVLHDRALLDERALQAVAAVGLPPVIFVNACNSASRVANLCFHLMVMGGKMVIGTRHKVSEGSASTFAETFYQHLVGGESAGESVRKARMTLREARDAGWASFFLYGDPSVSISIGEPSRAEHPPLPRAVVDTQPQDVMRRLDPDAEQLMRQVEELAGARRVVTSLDLLIGLLAKSDLRMWAEEAVGTRRLALTTELLTALDSTSRGHGTGEVAYSDTVRTVLARAGIRASEAGRTAITVTDIATAFVEVGAGSSGYLLEMLGISLADLKPDAGTKGTTGPRSSPGEATGPFDSDGRMRLDDLDRTVADAVRSALLLARSHRAHISTAVLLHGFGMADSEALRRGLAQQGELGAQAIRALYPSMSDLKRRHFSPRTRDALDQVRATVPGSTIGEAAVLRMLLTDERSSACEVLRSLGIDTDQLLRALPS